jgi:hypothetical protein
LENSNKYDVNRKYQQKGQQPFLYFILQICENVMHQINHAIIKEPDMQCEYDTKKDINRQAKPDV